MPEQIQWTNNPRTDRIASSLIAFFRLAQQFAEVHTCSLENGIVHITTVFIEEKFFDEMLYEHHSDIPRKEREKGESSDAETVD